MFFEKFSENFEFVVGCFKKKLNKTLDCKHVCVAFASI